MAGTPNEGVGGQGLMGELFSPGEWVAFDVSLSFWRGLDTSGARERSGLADSAGVRSHHPTHGTKPTKPTKPDSFFGHGQKTMAFGPVLGGVAAVPSGSGPSCLLMSDKLRCFWTT